MWLLIALDLLRKILIWIFYHRVPLGNVLEPFPKIVDETKDIIETIIENVVDPNTNIKIVEDKKSSGK